MDHQEIVPNGSSRTLRLIRRRRGRIGVLASWTIASFLAGAYCGLVSTPTYARDDDVVTYLEQHMKIAQETGDDTTLQLDVGLTGYPYSVKSNDFLEPVVIGSVHVILDHPSGWSGHVMGVLRHIFSTAVAETFITHLLEDAPATAKVVKPLLVHHQAALYAVAVVIGISGGFLGYEFTYDENKNLGAVTKDLPNKKYVFKRVAKILEAAPDIKETRDNLAVIEQVDPEKMFMTMYVNHRPIKLYELKAQCDHILEAVEKIRTNGRTTETS
jgi:hypothetical protein